MAEYKINSDLLAKAYEELAVNLRRRSPTIPESMIQDSARRVFSHSWHLATKHHDQHAPQPAKVVAESPALQRMADMPEMPERMRERLREQAANSQKRMQESNDKMHQMVVDNHRAGLIQLFTMSDGVSQATAEQIVDNHILAKKEG